VSNPIKQAQDHDPRGVLVRRWLPALRRVPDSWLFEPWLMPAELQVRCGLRVGVEIAEPLVDIEAATRAAKKSCLSCVPSRKCARREHKSSTSTAHEYVQ